MPVAPLTAAPSAAAGRIEVARPETIEDEATQVAHWMAAQLRGGARSGAVLCRKRSQFGPVVEALAQAGLPYEVVGIGGLLTTTTLLSNSPRAWPSNSRHPRSGRAMRSR